MPIFLISQIRVGQNEVNSGKYPMGRVERRDSLPVWKTIRDASSVTRLGSRRCENVICSSLVCVKDME
jgi:hypothetical protein